MDKMGRRWQSRRFGTILTVAVMLIVGLFLSVAPAPASTVSWLAETLPSTSGYVLFPGSDIADLAVGWDGTIYIVTGNDAYCYKSTNGGVTWSKLSYNFGTILSFVGVAPDDPDLVAVAGGTKVWVSTDGGTTWDSIGTVNDATAGGTQCAAIADITLSASDGTKKYVGVAGNTKGGMADFWYSDIRAALPKWYSTAKELGFDSMQDTGLAIAFSPNVASDKVMVAVSALSTTNTTFQMFSLNTKTWNKDAGFSDYPVNIQNGGNDIDGTDHAAIVMAPDYLGSDDAMRIVFVGLNVNNANPYGGVYRLKDDSDKAITDDKDIYSVDYDGTNIVAGAATTADGTKVYRSDNPLASDPDFSTTSALKRPGGENTVIVTWRGTDVVAGTLGDESAFAVSRDNGSSFNDISLIDTTLTALEDIAVSADGSKVYLATNDGTDLSLWRRVKSWERVLSLAGETGYIVRIAPNDPEVVYLAYKGQKTIYYTTDGGETKWHTRTSRYTIDDLAIETDGDTAYVLTSNGYVSKSTNEGFTWDSKVSCKLSGGSHMILSLDEDLLVAGSQDGYVSYSTNGNTSWTKLDDDLGDAVQVVAAGLTDGDFVFAASSKAGTKVRRWQIGTSTAWEDMAAPTTATYGAYGITLHDGVLYVANSDAAANSEVLRAVNPTASTVAWGTIASPSTTFTTEPTALRISTGSTKLWAIDTIGPSLLSYTDIVPDITVSPSYIDFGSLMVGSSSLPQTVTITNGGTVALVISTITIGGANADQFSIRNDNCSGQTIAPAGSATVEVVFSPTSTGVKSATLSIPSNDPDEGTVSVALSGAGAADISPPEVSITYSPVRPSTEDKVSFSANASDPSGIEGIDILVNDVTMAQCSTSSCSYTGGPYPEGTVTCSAIAYDRAGNQAQTGQKSFTVIKTEVDTTPPKIEITYSPEGPTTDDNVTFNATASDASGIEGIDILVNDVRVHQCSTSPCRYTGGPYPEGTVTCSAIAYDRAGNQAQTGQKSFTVIKTEVDTTPPKIEITYSPVRPSTEDRVSFSANASDPSGIEGIDILVNDVRVAQCSTSPCRYTGGPYPEGTVTCSAIAYDKAGNQAGTRHKSFTVIHSALPPVPTPAPVPPSPLPLEVVVTIVVVGGAAVAGSAITVRHSVRVRHFREDWQEKAKEEKLPKTCQPCTRHCLKKQLECEPALRKIEHLSFRVQDPVSSERSTERKIKGKIVDEFNKLVTARRQGEKSEKLQQRAAPLAGALLKQIIEWLHGEPAPRDVFISGCIKGSKVTFEFILYHCKRRGEVNVWKEEKKWKATLEDKCEEHIDTLHNLDPTDREILEKKVPDLTQLLIQFIRKV